jgi:hypothetical protein
MATAALTTAMRRLAAVRWPVLQVCSRYQHHPPLHAAAVGVVTIDAPASRLASPPPDSLILVSSPGQLSPHSVPDFQSRVNISVKNFFLRLSHYVSP